MAARRPSWPPGRDLQHQRAEIILGGADRRF
jgi:hypothetical protein